MRPPAFVPACGCRGLDLADDFGCHIGELVTVGHSAILHACTVKDEVLVGMGAIAVTAPLMTSGIIELMER
jgi:carbonic anhydrase/acetyltransferase-like protein (isoleucine patch superfamily)